MPRSIVDTNILVYLFDKTDAPKNKKALEWLKSRQGTLQDFAVLHQNLREFSAVFWKKKSIAKAQQLNEWLELITGVFDLLDDAPEDIMRANEVSEKTKAGFWDSLIASSMHRCGISTIYTEDTKDFSKIPGIRAINPLA